MEHTINTVCNITIAISTTIVALVIVVSAINSIIAHIAKRNALNRLAQELDKKFRKTLEGVCDGNCGCKCKKSEE